MATGHRRRRTVRTLGNLVARTLGRAGCRVAVPASPRSSRVRQWSGAVSICGLPSALFSNPSHQVVPGAATVAGAALAASRCRPVVSYETSPVAQGRSSAPSSRRQRQHCARLVSHFLLACHWRSALPPPLRQPSRSSKQDRRGLRPRQHRCWDRRIVSRRRRRTWCRSPNEPVCMWDTRRLDAGPVAEVRRRGRRRRRAASHGAVQSNASARANSS